MFVADRLLISTRLDGRLKTSILLHVYIYYTTEMYYLLQAEVPLTQQTKNTYFHAESTSNTLIQRKKRHWWNTNSISAKH